MESVNSWIFAFLTDFWPIKIDRFHRKHQIFKNSSKLTIFGLFDELLSTRSQKMGQNIVFEFQRQKLPELLLRTQCLKITEKVAFNIASEASYCNILSRQKLIKNAKNSQFWRVFENLMFTVKPVNFDRSKIGQKRQNSKAQDATFLVIFKHFVRNW